MACFATGAVLYGGYDDFEAQTCKWNGSLPANRCFVAFTDFFLPSQLDSFAILCFLVILIRFSRAGSLHHAR